MFKVTVSFNFEAAHRLLGHEGKCRHIHGHSYRAEFTLSGVSLGVLNMLIDFGHVKNSVGVWIDSYLDHNIILSDKDPLLRAPDSIFAAADIWQGKRPFIMPSGEQPTAEAIAKILFHVAADLLSRYVDVSVKNVRLYETERCWVDYSIQ